MSLDERQFEAEEQFDKAVQHLKDELRGLRTGRATTALVEFLKVEAYDTFTELRQLASISVPEPQQIVIKPFDPSVGTAIVKAIQTADIGLTPHSEGGKVIRVGVPSLSGDRRAKLVAQVKKMGEDAKVRIRNARRDVRKLIEKEQKEGLYSEDEGKRGLEELDENTKKYESQVDVLVTGKQAELQQV
jgi:ribosome recycling factor